MGPKLPDALMSAGEEVLKESASGKKIDILVPVDSQENSSKRSKH